MGNTSEYHSVVSKRQIRKAKEYLNHIVSDSDLLELTERGWMVLAYEELSKAMVSAYMSEMSEDGTDP